MKVSLRVGTSSPFLLILLALLLSLTPYVGAQAPGSIKPTLEDPAELPFYCPMDPEIRAKLGGKCSKCGMDLVLGIPDPVEYRVTLRTVPPVVEPGRPVRLEFEIREPGHDHRVHDFAVVHEKIFHLLYVSHDLVIFGHEHPKLGDDAVFRLETVFPKAGLYRLLADFYPAGATPQMAPLTLATAGFDQSLESSLAKLSADLAPKRGNNLTISLRTEPSDPLAGLKTLLLFELDTADGLEKFLGAWAHLLAASQDLVDLIHAHPAIADGGPRIQVNVIFPRPGFYRLWIQVQRNGEVNTVSFTVPVKKLE